MNQKLKSIYGDYLLLYQAEGIFLRPRELENLVTKATNKAKINYSRLKEPKTSSLTPYTHVYVRLTLAQDLATRTLKKISPDTPAPSSLKAMASFFSFFPPGRQNALRKKLYDSPPDKREEVWKSFKLPLDEIEKRFIQMTISRNEFAKSKDYVSYIDMMLDKYKIPHADYNKLIKNADKIIDYCNQQLPKIDNLPVWFYSEFNIPCFMCRLPTFPFKTLEEVLDYCAKKYKILAKFKHKLDIKLGNSSNILYEKETDTFTINIDKKNNIRHQSIDLIHELSHAINNLRDLKKGIDPLEQGSYLREKEALAIELAILKEISPELFQSHFAEALLALRRVLFETELYVNPKQNLSKLYAETFNRCFKKAKQKDNSFYILDERIVLRPLSTLPHAVAYATYLDKKS